MTIRAERSGSLLLLTIDRPERRNALTGAMRVALADRLEEAAGDRSVRAVLLAGAGDSFCAGADLGEFGEEAAPAARHRMQRGGHRIVATLHAMEKPVIAALRGHAIGLGWSIALACDLAVAAPSARFAMSHARVGLVPDCGAAWFLARTLGPMRARELIYTGRTLAAEEAHRLGLVSRIVEEAALEEQARNLAEALAAGPSFALGLSKRLIAQGTTEPLAAVLEQEALMAPLLRQTEDFIEGTTAFREKRTPHFTGQ